MPGISPLESSKTAAASAPDFRHVTHWVFDLDNTLYRADNGVFARIDARCRKISIASMAPP